MTQDLHTDLLQALLACVPRNTWGEALVFVPHYGALNTLRRACLAAGPGLLPTFIAADDLEPFASTLGVVLPSAANSWPVRAKAQALLQAAQPALMPAALIPRTEGLLQTLNLLAEHGITPTQLSQSVPEMFAALWAAQGQVLLSLWAWAAPNAVALLPAARRRAVVLQVAAKLAEKTAVIANPPPLVWLGTEPTSPALLTLYQTLLGQGMVPMALPVMPTAAATLEAATPWAEMQRTMLWLVQQLQAGGANTRIAVVASGSMAARLQTELALRFKINARVQGGTRWRQTPAGQALLQAAVGWLDSPRELSLAYWLAGLTNELPAALQEILAELATLPGRWDGACAYAWLDVALAALAPQAEGMVHDPRVQILPPHAATLQRWDALVVTQLVEGVWPANGHSGPLTGAQRQQLNMPDATAQAAHAGALLQQLLSAGTPQVLLTRSTHDDTGNPLLPSRWWPANAPAAPEYFTPAAAVAAPKPEQLGAWVPAMPPLKLSASFITALIACPYKAYAERVLGLAAADPLTPVPDKREVGTMVHAWLQAAAVAYPAVTLANQAEVVDFLCAEAARQLAAQPPLVQVLWQPKLQKLAPLIAAQWAAQGRTLQVEEWLSATLAEGTILNARADALGQTHEGMVVMDYKTGTPPGKTAMQQGTAPQLPLEAWLLQQRGSAVAGLEYWHLKGYGAEPLKVTAHQAAALVAPVAESLAMLQQTYLYNGARWPAVPDAAGAGVLATGACAYCALKGVCRREAVL